MSYVRGAVTVAAFVLPLIILYKLWYGRRSDSNDFTTIQLTDSISLVEAPSGTSESTNKDDDDDHEDDNNNNDNDFIGEQTDSKSLVGTSPGETSASSSYPSSSLPLPSVEYEVFLSFRGPDTRHQITDILYRFLIHTKIHTFKDDDELRRGEGIWSNLVRAIDQSKIYVPIISRSYADSKWCLKELAEIVERQRQDSRRIILPIFYMVDPRDVRHQTGPYRDAFQKHAQSFDEKTVKSWRDALAEVGTLKGWHVTSNNEQGGVADEVSAHVWSYLSKDNFVLETDELVGIDDHIEAVVEKLSLDSKHVTMVGIHGLGGIGKTTIAKAVYNKISSRFDRCCFVENIRETQEQKDGTTIIQKKLIFDILRNDSIVFSNDSEGRKIIRERVSKFKTLVILDDVDEKFRFEGILGSPKSFDPDSRFVITSRNVKVLSTLNENQCKLYEVGTMSHSRGLELFCKHAFKKNSPPSDYKSLADDIVSSTGGLPLTLKVIGSLLFKEETTIWEEKLKQLQETPELQVMERLKISYDTLTYEAQQIFLDIACFFIGASKERPSYMWSACNFYPATNINTLIQRSMLKVIDNDKFQMHDQLRDMGREIVRQEDVEHPWRRSRIWSGDGGVELLLNKKGSSQVKVLRVESAIDMDALGSECFSNLTDLRYFEAKYTALTGDFSNLLPNLKWLQLDKHQQREEDPPFTNLNMTNLVILALLETNLTYDWGGWGQIKMAKRLKVMDLSWSSKLTRLPYLPKSLEVLNLAGFNGGESEELNIGELKNLRKLTLRYGIISKINGGTFGMLKGLRELDLTNFHCKNLGDVVADVGELSSLKTLRTNMVLNDIEIRPPMGLKELDTSSRVSNLAELLELEVLEVYDCKDGFDIPPEAEEGVAVWWKVSKLKSISLRYMKINTSPRIPSLLPSSMNDLKIGQCKIAWLPSLHNLANLTHLEISDCQTLCDDDDMVMDGLEGMKSLKNVEIRRVDGLTQIRGLGDLLSSSPSKPQLEELVIHSCNNLVEVLQFELDDKILIHSLQTVSITRCPLLEVGSMMRGLSKFPMLKELCIYENNDEVVGESELKRLGTMEELARLTIGLSPSIATMPSLSRLRNLKQLEFEIAPSLQEIEGLGELKSLEQLHLQGCSSIERIPSLSRLQNLTRLTIVNASSLREIEGLEELKSLEELRMEDCPSLERIPSLSRLQKLKELKIAEAPSLLEIEGFGELKSLKDLELWNCPSLKRIPSLSRLQKLKELDIADAPSLHEIQGLGEVTSLKVLKLENCESLERIDSLSRLRKLEFVIIMEAPSLREIEGLEELPSLVYVGVKNCSSLERLWPADQQPCSVEKLRKLYIIGCKRITGDYVSRLKTSLPNTFVCWLDQVTEDADYGPPELDCTIV